jgi:hypothetical protein
LSALIVPRRSFLFGVATLIGAPAVVRTASLMPVKSWTSLLDNPHFFPTYNWEGLPTQPRLDHITWDEDWLRRGMDRSVWLIWLTNA